MSARPIVRKEEIEVSKDDQQNINLFSKLNQKFHEKNVELRNKNEQIDQTEDALTELDLIDDENDIRIKFGDCFVNVSEDFCRDYIEEQQKGIKDEIGDLKFFVEDTQKRMMKLKSKLYTKFGNSIHLEED